MKFPIRFSSVAFFLAASLAGSVASAHVRLIDPPPRVDGQEEAMQLKAGPCGQQPNGRTEIVTDFTGGETISVQFGEYINHPSYYRIALDVDGDDSFPMRPEAAVQQQGDDPASVHPLSDPSDTSLEVYILQYFMNDLSPGRNMEEVYTTDVTLPNIDCQNCTLQVIQFMYNDAEPHYFQCADITITAAASGDTTSTGSGGMTMTSAVTGTETTVTGSTVTGTTGAPGTTGATVPTTTTASTTTSGTTGFTSPTTTTGSPTTTTGLPASTTGLPGGTTGVPTGTTSAPPVAAADSTEEEGGCAFRAAPDASDGAWLAALLGLGILGYRRGPRAQR